MAQTEVNRKFLYILLFLAAAVGVVFICVNVFKPKADVTIPYNQTYAIVHNETFTNIKTINNTLTTKMENMAGATDLTTQCDEYINLFNSLRRVAINYTSINNILLKNIQYIEATKLLNYQDSLVKHASNFASKIDECNTYLETNVSPILEQPVYNNWILLNHIKNYSVLYKQAILELSETYMQLGNIYYSCAKTTFQANDFSKWTIYFITEWNKVIAELTCTDNSNQIENHVKLTNFISNNITYTGSDFINNTHLQEICANAYLMQETYMSNKLDASNDIIHNICNNTLDEFKASVENKDNIVTIDWLLNNYFLEEVE